MNNYMMMEVQRYNKINVVLVKRKDSTWLS